MRSFFASNTWPRSSGRLHVYAFANAPVGELAAAYHRVLTANGVTGLPAQPAAFLHVTIEQVQRYVDDLTPAELAALSAALGKHIAAVPAFDLTVGPALVTSRGILLDAVPDEPWSHLRQAVRAAAVETFGDDAVRPMSHPGAPHCTIAYATGPGAVDPEDILLQARPGRAVLPVTEVHLVAVTQDPAAAAYSWPDPLATFPLGPRPSS
jgi:hypothetical protein